MTQWRMNSSTRENKTKAGDLSVTKYFWMILMTQARHRSVQLIHGSTICEQTQQERAIWLDAHMHKQKGQ